MQTAQHIYHNIYRCRYRFGTITESESFDASIDRTDLSLPSLLTRWPIQLAVCEHGNTLFFAKIKREKNEDEDEDADAARLVMYGHYGRDFIS